MPRRKINIGSKPGKDLVKHQQSLLSVWSNQTFSSVSLLAFSSSVLNELYSDGAMYTTDQRWYKSVTN